MARTRTALKREKTGARARTPVVYQRMPSWAPGVKRRLALARALGRAGERPGERAALLEEASTLRGELITLRTDRTESRARDVSFKSAPRKTGTWTKTTLLGPSRVDIACWVGTGPGGEFQPSNLVYPCPDDGSGGSWSAWFSNGNVELWRFGRHEIEGSAFTGKVSVDLEAGVEGVADIEPGGSVRLMASPWVRVYRPTLVDSHLYWIMVAAGGMGGNLVETTTPGLVSLNGTRWRLCWNWAEARPGDVVETQQIVQVWATAAEVALGPSRSRCVGGGQRGHIETPPPRLELEYRLVATRGPRPHWVR